MKPREVKRKASKHSSRATKLKCIFIGEADNLNSEIAI